MTPLVALARDRLTRLAAALGDLTERVRQAVAAELGRLIGDTARDLVAAIAGGPALTEHRDRTPSSGRRRTPDPWDDEDEWDQADPGPDLAPEPADNSPASPTSRWMSALTAGVSVARRLIHTAAPPWAGAAAGLAVAGLVLVGGPVVRAAVAAVHMAAGLLALTDPHPLSP